jgi:hypothetical protein
LEFRIRKTEFVNVGEMGIGFKGNGKDKIGKLETGLRESLNGRRNPRTTIVAIRMGEGS